MSNTISIVLVDAGTHEVDVCEEDNHKFGIKCPHCSKWCAVMLYDALRIRNWWQWVGFEYREPYAQLATNCRRCKKPFCYTIYWPQ